MSPSATPSTRWYLILVAGLIPICVGGFVLSAVANRVVFALWSVVFGFGYAAAIRRGMNGEGRLGLALAAVGAAAAVLVVLLARHWDEVRLGISALMPVGETP